LSFEPADLRSQIPPAIDRRFAAVGRLIGAAGLERLRAAHVVVVGLGGVGSWAAEALARSGVGALTLIDLDHVAESNLNRQLHATQATLGAAKVVAMQERIRSIMDDCRVTVVDAFVTAEDVEVLLPPDADGLIDATDAPRAKAAMIAWAARMNCAMVVCGAAGGRLDPLALRRSDLAQVQGDRLLAAVRARLRRDHDFPGPGQRFGVAAIHAVGAPMGLAPARDAAGGAAPLACAGYGSIVTVTAAMGFAAAGAVMDALLVPRLSAARASL